MSFHQLSTQIREPNNFYISLSRVTFSDKNEYNRVQKVNCEIKKEFKIKENPIFLTIFY